MGYYQGDYYQGDYYRGDPGLFDIVKKVGGAIFKATPVGAAVSAVTSAFKAKPAPLMLAPPPMLGGGPIITQSPLGTPVSPVGLAKQGLLTDKFAKGYHLNKSTYVSRGGGTSRWGKGLELHLAGTVAVKNRHMRVTNDVALRRALRRVSGFAKIVKRSRRAISRAASAVGVRRGGRVARRGGAPAVRIVKAG